MTVLAREEFITGLRKIFIIENLLDGEIKHVTKLMVDVDESIENYLKNYPEKINYTKSSYETIGKAGRKLIDDKILMRAKAEKENKGASGFEYWINMDMSTITFIKAYLEIWKVKFIGKKSEMDKEQDFIRAGGKFINSKFAKPFLNTDLLNTLESSLKSSIDLNMKEYIIKAAIISPTALLIIFIYTNLMENKRNRNVTVSGKDVIPMLLGTVTNSLISDLFNPAFSSNVDFELNHAILLKKSHHTKVNVINIDHAYKNQTKTYSISWNQQNMIDSTEKLLSYNELLSKNKNLEYILSILFNTIYNVIKQNPECKKLLLEAMEKEKSEILEIGTGLKNESLKSEIDEKLVFFNIF